jgi:catalase
MRHFLQDGHMAMQNPKGRVNYEPNSFSGGENNPRECPVHGFKSSESETDGGKLRYRSETFSDHYSQARQFYLSQTDIEQTHIQDALIFELSKVEHLRIRERVVSHLLNIDNKLAEQVALGLGLQTMPDAAEAALDTRQDLPVSDALSILKNAPNTFKGRKLGILVSDGFDAETFNLLTQSLKEEGASHEVIAAQVGGAKNSNGEVVEADQVINGGPSVLYDAIVLLTTNEGAKKFAEIPEAKDFVSDAYAHMKYIGFSDKATPLIEATGLNGQLDDGWLDLNKISASEFVSKIRNLRYWSR